MFPKCNVNLGSGAVKVYVFIKNSWVVSMLGWILVTCGTHCYDSCIFEAKFTCGKIHKSLVELAGSQFVFWS